MGSSSRIAKRRRARRLTSTHYGGRLIEMATVASVNASKTRGVLRSVGRGGRMVSTWKLAEDDAGGSGGLFLPEEQLVCKQGINRRCRK